MKHLKCVVWWYCKRFHQSCRRDTLPFLQITQNNLLQYLSLWNIIFHTELEDAEVSSRSQLWNAMMICRVVVCSVNSSSLPGGGDVHRKVLLQVREEERNRRWRRPEVVHRTTTTRQICATSLVWLLEMHATFVKLWKNKWVTLPADCFCTGREVIYRRIETLVSFDLNRLWTAQFRLHPDGSRVQANQQTWICRMY